MCDICEKHGKGVKWYLNPENFDDDLVLKDPRRMKVVESITAYSLEYYVYNSSRLARLVNMLPQPIRAVLTAVANKMAYDLHAGQVVPLEDALKIVEIAHNHVVIPCYCRRLTGGKEELTCLNFGLVKELWPKYRPQDNILELDVNGAKELLREWDEKGYVHAVFWAKVPYVIAICNCEKRYCTALRNRLLYGIKNSYKKSHYVAVIDENLCDFCGGSPRCVSRCQFGAIRVDRDSRKVAIRSDLCFGCGLCRDACDNQAIRLVSREEAGVKVW